MDCMDDGREVRGLARGLNEDVSISLKGRYICLVYSSKMNGNKNYWVEAYSSFR